MKILSKERVFDKFFAVEEIKLQSKEGEKPVTRYYVDKVKGAGILLFKKKENKIILTKQYRVPLNEKAENELLEIPAGVVDAEESAETCIIREVMEETGYKISRVTQLFSFYTSPGYNNEEVVLFYGTTDNADKTGKGGGLEKEQEKIQVVEMSTEECFRLLDEGKIVDAKTLIALLWLKNELGK